jgi:hypothetical protein
LQDDPLATEYLDTIEKVAIEDMIAAKTDDERRQHRDTVRAVRAFRALIDMEIQRHAEAKRPTPSVA